MTSRRGGVLRLALAVGAALAASLWSPGAEAQVKTVRLAKQFGISYLPLTIMEDKKLLEEQAQKLGVEVKTEWLQLSAGSPMNEALISGNLDFASGGVGPLLTIWSRTRANLKVKGVAAINSMPIWLTTINPDVKTIKDFTEKDRIALPAVKVSIQAVTLQMAAEQAFGPGQHGRLDTLTVSMSHPDGMAAMMSGRSEVTGHFTSAPFQYQELADPRVRKVVDSLRRARRAAHLQRGLGLDALSRREPEDRRGLRRGPRRGGEVHQRETGRRRPRSGSGRRTPGCRPPRPNGSSACPRTSGP